MDDDSRVIDKGWDALPEYGNSPGDADDAVTVSISTTPGEWLVNTVDAVVVPMSMVEVVQALQEHKLTERSLVWRAGMPEWAAVDKIPQLMLAARMPVSAPSASPPRPTPAAGKAPSPSVIPTASVVPATASKPPPKPVRSPAQPASVPPQSIPSRKATLPFGLPAPLAPQSRPSSNPRASVARLAVPPEASNDEPEVLAVYARPAATICFDLAPVEPRRTTSTAPPTPPQTLAPTTTDSAQRRGPVPRNADLSVVAASDFRQVKRSSQRLVWISSLASAAAASLLTFALSRGGTAGAPTPPEAGHALAAAQPVAPAVSAAPLVAPPPPSPEPASAAPELPTPTSEAPAPAPKPKATVRKARAVAARPAQPKPDPGASTRDPASEPNPYDVKLEDEPAAKPAATAAHGSGLEADGDAPQASSSGSTSPGF
jgi:hypothetical protein